MNTRTTLLAVGIVGVACAREWQRKNRVIREQQDRITQLEQSVAEMVRRGSRPEAPERRFQVPGVDNPLTLDELQAHMQAKYHMPEPFNGGRVQRLANPQDGPVNVVSGLSKARAMWQEIRDITKLPSDWEVTDETA